MQEKRNLNLLNLEQASEFVRTFSGEYPVCIITSPRGASIIKPLLEACGYVLNGTEVRLLIDEGCEDDALFFLPQKEFDKFMKASGRDN